MQRDRPAKPYHILGRKIGKIHGGAHRRARRSGGVSRTAPWDVIPRTPRARGAEHAPVTVPGENTGNLAAHLSSAAKSLSVTHPGAERSPSKPRDINKISGALGMDGCKDLGAFAWGRDRRLVIFSIKAFRPAKTPFFLAHRSDRSDSGART